MKIQEVFANLGGIISFINLIFSNISLIFNSHDKNIKLINKLFEFSNLGSEKNLLKIIEDQNNYDKKIDFSLQSNRIILPNSFSNSNVIQEIEDKSYQNAEQNIALNEDFKKLIKDQKKKFKLEPLLISFLCRSKSNKKQEFLLELFSKATEIINKKLDINGYLRFIEEYITLKELLLDEISNLCLTLSKKPKIYESNNFVNVNLSKSERLKRVISYFVNNPNRIANNIYYEILDDELKKIVKNILNKK